MTEDRPIIICHTVKELPEPTVESEERPCGQCGVALWVSCPTLVDTGGRGIGVCRSCALDIITQAKTDGEPVEFDLGPATRGSSEQYGRDTRGLSPATARRAVDDIFRSETERIVQKADEKKRGNLPSFDQETGPC